jgi:hypothetical protein
MLKERSTSSKWRVVLLLAALSLFAGGEVWAADWIPISSDPDQSLYYDPASLTRPSPNTGRVWVKSVYHGKNLEEVRRLLGKGYENFHHKIVLYEADCRERTIRVLQVSSYTWEDKPINVAGPLDRPVFVVPGSLGEFLYGVICK